MLVALVAATAGAVWWLNEDASSGSGEVQDRVPEHIQPMVDALRRLGIGRVVIGMELDEAAETLRCFTYRLSYVPAFKVAAKVRLKATVELDEPTAEATVGLPPPRRK